MKSHMVWVSAQRFTQHVVGVVVCIVDMVVVERCYVCHYYFVTRCVMCGTEVRKVLTDTYD